MIRKEQFNGFTETVDEMLWQGLITSEEQIHLLAEKTHYYDET